MLHRCTVTLMQTIFKRAKNQLAPVLDVEPPYAEGWLAAQFTVSWASKFVIFYADNARFEAFHKVSFIIRIQCDE